MNEKLREALGKKAYDTHMGLLIPPDNEEAYFKVDVSPWGELPRTTQAHWEKIAMAVYALGCDLEKLDYGDLHD